MAKRYRDRDWLEERYHGDGLTQQEIGELCGVSATTIRTWMREFGLETREVAGENHGLYGTDRSEETKRKISETLAGREFSEETLRRFAEGQRGKPVPEDARRKISEALTGRKKTEETRRKMSCSTAGEHNPNWKGGEYAKEWYGPDWTVIRDQIRERDEVCQYCCEDGSRYSLDVHHIVPIRYFREADGVSIDEAHCETNLVLLCRPCHAQADHGTIEVRLPEWDELPEAMRDELDG